MSCSCNIYIYKEKEKESRSHIGGCVTLGMVPDYLSLKYRQKFDFDENYLMLTFK